MAITVALIFARLKYGEHSPPLGLGYLAAVLEKQGHHVCIIDLTFEKSFSFLEERLRDVKPALIGITCQTTFADDAFTAAKLCRQTVPGAVIVIGGPHATILPEQTLSESQADIVVAGEGECALSEIARCIERKEPFSQVKGIYYRKEDSVVYSGRREFIDDLDSIPFPGRHLFDRRYFDFPEITMISSRGCPFNCSFCQPTLKRLFGDKVRLRSPGNVMAEIISIFKVYGNKIIRFHDDTFTWDKDWVKKLCALIEEQKLVFSWNCKSRIDVLDREMLQLLKRSGCRRLDLGVESGSARLLRTVLNKGITVEKIIAAFKMCYEEKMPVLAFIMVGCPGETPRDILDTVHLLEKIYCDGLHVSIFTPFPGTRIFDFAREQDLICAQAWSEYDFYSSVSLKSDYFSAVEIKEIKETIENGIKANNLFRRPLRLLLCMPAHPRTFARSLYSRLRLQKLKTTLRIKQRRVVEAQQKGQS
ncbi:MAG: B12-binding domain-containing radical SAM protein [Candidatus Omnitrophica bacterium]|nr:B12-binding domain-containing radical SAM protein [Candidatus Omnitrophota bacterium]MBU4477595.1 B12-binding domain-containing radical SAM protein [Candidatus Omnitrophota bacterium]MCG2702802.1 B12-binding domain-containing radical SAM protein [Candidatus Omnitrophota bacterium]